ncbi:hypothetical protein QQF64_031289 [Cirrhinus molitorella]|uniref:Integrase zinc-binding domain-containing protein n=1 Tax=Cirrhinus molitorella TaxID=172907 RepID=A0ABR3MWI0_9TELE
MYVIRVGGRLRRAEALDIATKHPIVLDPSHALTRLIIQDYDHQLKHPGPERVLAEIRRKFWILRGREAIRSHQFRCTPSEMESQTRNPTDVRFACGSTSAIQTCILLHRNRLLRALLNKNWTESGEKMGNNMEVSDNQMCPP